MKHITYLVQVSTLSGWHTIYNDPCYSIASMFASSLLRYTVNSIRIYNAAVGYLEQV